MKTEDERVLAGIQYVGLSGISKECKDAVLQLLQCGEAVGRVLILTNASTHCLLLTVGVGDLLAVKSGFGSGYGGEGPAAFSCVLQLLDRHGAEIDEHEVPLDLIERLDDSALTKADVDNLEAARPVRPRRWHSYVNKEDSKSAEEGSLWQEFPPVVPLAAIDPRIVDLAISFWEDPDQRLLTGYRRLEDTIRARTGLHEHGQKLLSQAFLGDAARLGWEQLDKAEAVGRGQLVTGAFMAYRNPRSHRLLGDHRIEQLREFLLLNHLYVLEREASERKVETTALTPPTRENA